MQGKTHVICTTKKPNENFSMQYQHSNFSSNLVGKLIADAEAKEHFFP